jgi:hypothetical protein
MTLGLGALAECVKIVPHRAQRVSRPGSSRRKKCSEIPRTRSLFFLGGQNCRWTFLLTDYASDQKLDGFGTLCSSRSLLERLQPYPLDFNCHQRLSTKSTITLPSWAFKFAQKVILSAELAHGATSCTWGWPMGPTGARGGGGL